LIVESPVVPTGAAAFLPTLSGPSGFSLVEPPTSVALFDSGESCGGTAPFLIAVSPVAASSFTSSEPRFLRSPF